MTRLSAWTRIPLAALMALAAVTSSGCFDDTSAKKTMESAFAKLMANDAKGFRQLLAGQALEQFSTKEAQDQLREQLKSYGKLTLLAPMQTEVVYEPYRVWPRRRIFEAQATAEVGGWSPVVVMAVVDCQVLWAPPSDAKEQEDPANTEGKPYLPEQLRCRITSLAAGQ